jgi:dolichol-phosphate mannosyltransferase
MSAEPPIAGKFGHRTSILVTAYNEDVVVEQVIRGAHAIAERMLETYELILIDDGSTDETGPIMDRLANELTCTRALHNRPNVGFGASYMRGVAEARYDYVMLVCGDNGLPTSNLPAIIEKIGTADIVIPYMRNLRAVKTPLRYLISRTYTKFLNIISGFNLHYYNGLSVHRRDLVNKISVRSAGFGFQGEILVKLLKSGHSYIEVGVDAASKEQQRSGFLRPRNIVNVIRTCATLLKDLRAFERRNQQGPKRTTDKRGKS